MLWVLAAFFLLAAWTAGQIVFARAHVVGEARWGASGPVLRVSLIVPARDEEKNLPKLLASLASERALLEEILVVDDHSTDATASRARDFGARVLASETLPDGWTGKNWACHQGARAARGDIFVFVDADVEFEPGALERILFAYERGGRGALSVLPYHRIEKPYEELSSFFNLLMAMGTGAFSRSASRSRLVGQCLCLSRADYHAFGGHEAVRDRILENFSMSEKLEASGIRCRTFLGRGCLRMRMFPDGVARLWQGWTKAFARGSREAPRGALAASVLWTFGPMTLMTLAFLPGVPFFFLLFFWALFAAQIGVFFARVGSFSKWGALLFPLPLLFYQAAFFFSLAKQRPGARVTWRGRSVPSGGDAK
jgi:4,4'-diaponeurosporenoate glycosyltransferase